MTAAQSASVASHRHGAHFDAAESWSRDAIEAYQLQALRTQLQRVGAESDYYRETFARAGFAASDLRSLDDLARLPFTRKADYVATITPENPYGSFMCAPRSAVRRMHFSSGTTAAPSPQFWSARDLDRWAALYARNAHAQGVRAGDVFQCMFTYTWFVGGLGATAGYQRAGALVDRRCGGARAQTLRLRAHPCPAAGRGAGACRRHAGRARRECVPLGH